MLLDTSGLFGLFDENEARHTEAVALYETATRRLTHSYVLAEFIPLCRSRGAKMDEALTFLTALVNNPRIEVVWIDEPWHRLAVSLLRRRPDKAYSLCDAVSFAIMKRRRIREALTTDRHFEQEGFVRLLKP